MKFISSSRRIHYCVGGHENYPLIRRIPFSDMRDVCIEDMRQKQKSRAIFRPLFKLLKKPSLIDALAAARWRLSVTIETNSCSAGCDACALQFFLLLPSLLPCSWKTFAKRKSNFGREFRELNYHIETGRFYDKEIALR